MIRLALLRHGRTQWNNEGRLQGRTDIPLEDASRAHLANLALPDQWRHADLLSSPLCRAIDTAQALTGRTPAIEPALLEMNWGDWEGQRGAELRADPVSGYRDLENWGWDFCPPGGETPADVRDRVLPWALALQADTLAITHIGIMRVLLACATGWNFDGPPPVPIKRDRLYILECTLAGLSFNGPPLRLKETSTCV